MLTSTLREHRASELYADHHLWQDVDALRCTIDQMYDWYLLRLTDYSMGMEILKTDHGTWLSKKMVSIPNTSQGNSPNSPKFVGTKTTMEFKPTDGSKAVVGMTRYNLLTTRIDGDGLDLDVRSVFTLELNLCFAIRHV